MAGSFAGMFLVLALWMSVQLPMLIFFSGSVESAFETAGLLAVGLVLFMLFELTINVDIFRNLPTLPRQSSDPAQQPLLGCRSLGPGVNHKLARRKRCEF